MLRPSLALVAIATSAALLPGQDSKHAPGPNYELAQRFSSEYVSQRTYSTSVSPNWIGETDRFWYSYEDRFGWRYELVDPSAPKEARKRPLFDRDSLAAKLSQAVKQPLDAEQMRLSNTKVSDDAKVFTFVYKDNKFELDLVTGDLADKGKATEEERRGTQNFRGFGRNRGVFFPGFDGGGSAASSTHRTFAPDNTAYVFAKGHNLYYVEADEATRKTVLEINAAVKAEAEAKEKAEAKAKKDGAKAEEKQEEKDDAKEKAEKAKVSTVQVKRRGEKPFPTESDKARKWADQIDERTAIKLTEDGAEDYSFSGREPSPDELDGGQANDFDYDDYAWDLEQQDPSAEKVAVEEGPLTRPSISWSPDSTAFYVMRSDSRDLPDLFLVNSIAEPRPALEQYDYPMPGEDKIRRSELYVFDRADVELSKIKATWKDEQYRSLRWSEDDEDEKTPSELRFLRQDRLVRNLEYVSLNPTDLAETSLLSEGFEAANVSPQGPRYLEERDEFIWWSDRTGWGHFYLYDGEGNLKNAITAGKWRASQIVDVDEEKGLLFFRGNGKEEGNIYLEHVYRVYLDGSGLACVTGDKDDRPANHSAELSPTKSYLVDNCSRIDMAPASVLRDAEGTNLGLLEESDLTRLYEAGWQMPETFTVKAADGVTELFGNMWKPFDFNPKRKYPVIAEVYPGPQTEGVSHTFSSINSRQQLAQVGFIVIQVGHRGGTPTRSKAYHSYGYFNLRDYGLEDKKVAIEQLAERYSFVDVDRVGLYGHSGGGFMTAAAMMVPPYNEFFKVGVSSAGNHDNNIYNNYWSERYHGLKEVAVEKEGQNRSRGGERNLVVNLGPQDEEKKDGEKETRFDIHIPTTQELAANLKGNLLLVHGEIDNNVHPANTMRLVDALIKANKRFDLLIIPGARHGFGAANGYFNQLRWEFFAEHLLGDHQLGADIQVKD